MLYLNSVIPESQLYGSGRQPVSVGEYDYNGLGDRVGQAVDGNTMN